MSGRRLRSKRDLTAASALPPTNVSTRPRRNTATRSSGTTIERSSPEVGRDSVKLTIKAPPSKLAEATSGPRGRAASIKVNSRDTFVGGEIVTGPRASRKKAIVEETSEEEDEPDPEADYEDEEDVDQDDLDDGEEEEEEEEVEEDDEDEEEIEVDEDAEGEEDEDIEMEDIPPPPPPKQKSAPVLPKVTITKASHSKLPFARDIVEEKEMTMDDDDDELSELSEEDEELGGDEEGEELGDDDEEGDEDDEDDEEDSEMTPATSRGMTPDLSKLTRRQRAAYQEYDGGLMALSNEAQKKKHLTAEEYAARRAEMARRRKNLSEKRNEEEKMDTINRLLKKQAPKRRRRADASEALGDGEDGEMDVERAPAVFTRYIQTTDGSAGARIAVPDEWINNQSLGAVFSNPIKADKTRKWTGRMVEEVA